MRESREQRAESREQKAESRVQCREHTTEAELVQLGHALEGRDQRFRPRVSMPLFVTT
jgi:hypothetical protein